MSLGQQIIRLVEKLKTNSTNTDDVLKPDGSGGVEFGPVPPAPGVWGGITGTLSDQTDLQSELDGKEPTIPTGLPSDYITGTKTVAPLDKAAVGLDQVDNTSDLDKPISTATQAALDTKADDAAIHPIGKSGQINDAIVPGTPVIGNTIFRDTVNSWLERLIQLADVVGLTAALGDKADQSSLDTHINNVSNPHNTNKNQLGLNNVDNTADVDKPISNDTQAALDLKEDLANKGVPNGYCDLDSGGLVPANRIPVSGLNPRGVWDADTNTPTLGDSGAGGVTNDFFVVSVAGNTSLDGISTWGVGDEVLNANGVWNRIPNVQSVTSVFGRDGAVVQEAGDYNADQITETATGKIMTDLERAAIPPNTTHRTSDGKDHADVVLNNSHRVNVSNPHFVTKDQVGLGNVDNTSDLDKPISTAQQAEFNQKVEYTNNLDALNDVTYDSVLNGQAIKRVGGEWTNAQLTPSDVQLGNVDNTSDLDKPISTATQAALDTKVDGATLDAHVNDTANPHAVTKEQVGLGNVDNTADVDKPVPASVQVQLDLISGDLTAHENDNANPHFTNLQQVVDNGNRVNGFITADNDGSGFGLSDGSGNLAGFVSGDSEFGTTIYGSNDGVNLNRPLTLGSSSTIIAGDQFGIQFTGAEAGDFLRVLNPVDINGRQIFPISTVALDVTQYTESFTDTANHVTSTSYVTVLNSTPLVNTYFDGSSQALFEFTVQNASNADKVVEYSITQNDAAPTEIFTANVARDQTVTISGSDSVTGGDIAVGSTIQIKVRTTTASSGGNTTVIGATNDTTLRMEQQAALQNQIYANNEINVANSTLVPGTINEIVTPGSQNLPEIGAYYAPPRRVYIGVANYSGGDITINTDPADDAYTTAGVVTSFTLKDGEIATLYNIDATQWSVISSSQKVSTVGESGLFDDLIIGGVQSAGNAVFNFDGSTYQERPIVTADISDFSGPAYAEIYRNTDSGQVIPLAGSILTWDGDGVANNCTADSAQDRVTVTVAGDYDIEFEGTVYMGKQTEFEVQVYVNGAFSKVLGTLSTKDETDIISGYSLGGITALAANDYVQIFVDPDANNKDFDMKIGTRLKLVKLN